VVVNQWSWFHVFKIDFSSRFVGRFDWWEFHIFTFFGLAGTDSGISAVFFIELFRSSQIEFVCLELTVGFLVEDLWGKNTFGVLEIFLMLLEE